jgi:release factor glutamine methyltransferase
VSSSNVSARAALHEASEKLPFLEARALLCHALACSPAQLLSHPEQELASDAANMFGSLVERRAAGEPVAYLLGFREFFGRRFKVTRDVLIPRPETELLVEIALEKIPAEESQRVLDLGTGCGNIATIIALARPHVLVTAVDISYAALELARENGRLLGAENVRWMHGDWFSELRAEKFDVVVANPPYVAARDPHLNEGDLRFEPAAALASGLNGLNAIREIIAGAPRYLHSSGWLLFEHGFDQADACVGLLRARGFTEVFSADDLAGIRRVAGGRLTDGPLKS